MLQIVLDAVEEELALDAEVRDIVISEYNTSEGGGTSGEDTGEDGDASGEGTDEGGEDTSGDNIDEDREDDEKDDFDRLIVRHTHAYYLRKHGANMVAVWCNADLFARKEKLHGLFSGMIISEMSEAFEYEIETTQEELDRETLKLIERLRTLLDEEIPLHEIPQRILELDDVHTPLTEFNYKNFFYL